MFKGILLAFTLITTLGGVALVPATASAQGVELRFYDRGHKDYHRWNGDEDRRYRAYLAERHRRYLAFQRASRTRQREYWRWRHEHEGR
jgi:hypothetical protein